MEIKYLLQFSDLDLSVRCGKKGLLWSHWNYEYEGRWQCSLLTLFGIVVIIVLITVFA